MPHNYAIRKSCHMPFPRKLIPPFTLQFSIVLFVIQYQFSNSNYLYNNAFNANFPFYLKKAGLSSRNVVFSTKLFYAHNCTTASGFPWVPWGRTHVINKGARKPFDVLQSLYSKLNELNETSRRELRQRIRSCETSAQFIGSELL